MYLTNAETFVSGTTLVEILSGINQVIHKYIYVNIIGQHLLILQILQLWLMKMEKVMMRKWEIKPRDYPIPSTKFYDKFDIVNNNRIKIYTHLFLKKFNRLALGLKEL